MSEEAALVSRHYYNFCEDIRSSVHQVHLKKLTLAAPMEEYSGRLAGLTPGFAGADIANMCNEVL